MADSAEDKEKAEKLAAAKKRVCSVHVAILLLSCVLPLLRTTSVSFFPFLFVFFSLGVHVTHGHHLLGGTSIAH